MIFTVIKAAGGWAVFSPTGTKLDVKKTKAAAMVLAGIMAGWAGKVVVKG